MIGFSQSPPLKKIHQKEKETKKKRGRRKGKKERKGKEKRKYKRSERGGEPFASLVPPLLSLGRKQKNIWPVWCLHTWP
jgi:hypothetical protein